MVKFLALLFMFSGLVCLLNQSHAQSEGAQFCTPLLRRPNAPRDLLPAQVVDGVPISRHHIIPSSMLMQFYNLARDIAESSQDSGVQQTIRSAIRSTFDSYYDLTGSYVRPQPRVRSVIESRLGLADTSTGQHDFSNILQMFVIWMPGNIFYGPTARLRDPGNNLDVDAEYIIGSRNFARIRDLFNRIMNFNTDIDRSIDNFYEIFEEMHVLVSRPPTAANLDQWEAVYKRGVKKYYIKRPSHDELRRRRQTSDELRQHLSFMNEQPMCYLHTLMREYTR